MVPRGVDLSKVIIQNKQNNNDRYRWVKSEEFPVRSLLSGRFYRNRKGRDAADRIFYKINYLGFTKGFLKNPKIGAENIKKVDGADNALSRKTAEFNACHAAKISSVIKHLWSNPVYVEGAKAIRGNDRDTSLYRNGVQVLRRRFCQRVPVGQEHLLEKNGVVVQNNP